MVGTRLAVAKIEIDENEVQYWYKCQQEPPSAASSVMQTTHTNGQSRYKNDKTPNEIQNGNHTNNKIEQHELPIL